MSKVITKASQVKPLSGCGSRIAQALGLPSRMLRCGGPGCNVTRHAYLRKWYGHTIQAYVKHMKRPIDRAINLPSILSIDIFSLNFPTYLSISPPIYLYPPVHLHIYLYLSIHPSVHTSIHTYVSTYARACMHAFIQACMHGSM